MSAVWCVQYTGPKVKAILVLVYLAPVLVLGDTISRWHGCTQCIANDINPMSLANSHTYSLLLPVLLKPGREKTFSIWYINNDDEIYGFEWFKGLL